MNDCSFSYVLVSEGPPASFACSTMNLLCSYYTTKWKALDGEKNSPGKTAPLIIEMMTVQDTPQENVAREQDNPSSTQLPSTLFMSSPKMLCGSANSLNTGRTRSLQGLRSHCCSGYLNSMTKVFKSKIGSSGSDLIR